MFYLYAFIVIGYLHPALGIASIKNSLELTEIIKEPVLQKWLAINYYHKKIDGSYVSEITNKDYFVSSEGNTNPLAEFNHFKNLITSYMKDGSNKEILCKFPARLTLFSHNYDWFHESDRPVCKEYIEENHPESVKSISLFFASGYFDNPSSYYGHMLLKFNYGEEVTSQTSLDSSLNYGANATNSEGGLTYILKGLFGGYEASYQRNNHFIFTNNYTNRQIRDIWEYRLNLTPEERRFMVEHSWELKNARFKYYFFSNNCANRIAKIVELATGRNLSKTSGFWFMPMGIVRNAVKTNNNQTSLIALEVYNPSLKKTFSDKYNLLNWQDKKQFIEFFDSSDSDKEKLVKTLDANKLLLALEHLDLQVAKQTTKNKNKEDLKRRLDILEKQRSIILVQLLQLPPLPVKTSEAKDPSYTLLKSQPASSIRLGYQTKETGDALKINYRASNNDFLNPVNPGQEVSKFIMGEIETEITNKSANITRVVAVDILNINTNPLPMRLTKEYSWGLKVDYAPSNNICTECSNLGLEGKVGTATRVNSKLMLYGLAGGRVHTTTNNKQDFLTVVSEIGSVINTSEHSIFALATNYNIDAISGRPEYLLKANLSINFSKDIDYRISVENNGKGAAIIASIGYYFD